MSPFKYLPLLAALSVSDLASAAESDDTVLEASLLRSTMARPIGRTAPKYPAVERRKGRQGWAELSFVVSRDGKVVDPVIENSSGNARFERAAITTVSEWLYEPATRDGEPVEQCRTNMLVSFALEGGLRESRSFAKRYNGIAAEIKAGDFDRAQAGIDNLFGNDRLTMYEIAHTRVLAGRLAEAMDNDREALRHYHKAIVSNGLWMKDETHARVLWSVAALELQVGSLSAGFRHYDKLVEIVGPGGDNQGLTNYVREVRAELETRTVLETPADLHASSSCEECAVTWKHVLLRRHFGLDEIQGTLDNVDIRCDWKRVVDTAREGVTWSVPGEWGNCHLLVTGAAGSTFSVLETNDLAAATE